MILAQCCPVLFDFLCVIRMAFRLFSLTNFVEQRVDLFGECQVPSFALCSYSKLHFVHFAVPGNAVEGGFILAW